MSPYQLRGPQPRDGRWTPGTVRGLRRHLGLSQREFAQEMNARQQTVSEWETGRYRPRGPSARLLSLIAEQAGFYEAGPAPPPPEPAPDAPAPGPAPSVGPPPARERGRGAL